MAVNLKSEDGLTIRKFFPLTTLPSVDFEALCADISVEAAESGAILFSQGDATTEYFYLLSGAICLQAKSLVVETIQADSHAARFAIAHQIPRKIDAIAANDIRFLRINIDRLNNQESIFFEEENIKMFEEQEENSGDWMTTLLKSPIFQRLPASNLQKILIEMEDVEYKKGDVLIQQGDTGDYYFVIKSGQCMLTRKPTPNAREIKLAQLREHDAFGEDSLISGAKRNVTVTALTDMILLRIDKEKFITLIKDPALRFVDYQTLQQELDERALMLDVRPADEYNKGYLEGSINAPFFSLRMQVKTLNRKRKIYVICEDGKTSEAAAFLLIRNKFDAVILQGGIQNVPTEAITNKAAFAVDNGVESISAQSEPIPDGEASGALPSAQPAAENARQQPEAQISDLQALQEICKQLKAENTKLTQEKLVLEQQYRALYKQTEKLKSLLDKLKAGS